MSIHIKILLVSMGVILHKMLVFCQIAGLTTKNHRSMKNEVVQCGDFL